MIYDETRQTQRWIFPSRPNWGIAQGDQDIPGGWLWKDGKDDDGWNELRIVCRGTKIQTYLNGVRRADFDGAGILDDEVHKRHNVGLKGHIALQLHSGDSLWIEFKDIEIRELK